MTSASQDVFGLYDMATINRNISRYETTAVYTHPSALVDIILVHGLNGKPDATWTSRPSNTFWPIDLLPSALRDAHANILVYGYNADVYSHRNDKTASSQFIHQHAQTLVTNLTLFRRGEGGTRRPIIWVCHSLGGILVKRALLYSNDLRASMHEDFRSIYISTFGIIFLGTPHTGADAATWGLMLQAMADVVVPRRFFESESVLLRTLKKDNETLVNINDHFLDIYHRFRIHMAHESHKTDIKGTRLIIVDAQSASPPLPGVTYYGIEATHSGMCKFSSPSAPGFRALSTDLYAWTKEAPTVIYSRWCVEDEERAARVRNEVSERMSPYRDLSPSYRLNSSRPRSAPQSVGRETLDPGVSNTYWGEQAAWLSPSPLLSLSPQSSPVLRHTQRSIEAGGRRRDLRQDEQRTGEARRQSGL